MSSGPQKPFSLRPWPHGDRKPKTLGEFIARVNAERGGFRTVTEESLRKEIEAQENGVGEANGADEMEVDSEEEGDSTQVKIEDIIEARNEVIKDAEVAHQNAMLALDFVSLLLTKEMPNQARTTLSNALRDHVGLGTLGATKLATSNLSEARLQDNKMVSTGWKFTDIDRTVNSVLTSASRLQKEISLETKYWAEVLAVSDSGWAVSRVPHERHTLGVRYGFSEAAATFRNSSLAAMRRSDEGTVDLDCGRTVAESQRLLVTIERNGKAIGRSSLPKPLPEDAALQDRVLEARNTIFNQELWHEINREGRSLLAYNVRLEESTISYNLDESSKVIFSLQALGDELDESTQNHSDNAQAESISAMLNLLLSYAHEQNNHRRSQPSGITRFQSNSTPPYALLRPIIAYLQHGRTLAEATKFISDLTTILQSSGISTAHYKLTEPPMSPSMPRTTPGSRSLPSEALIRTLLDPLRFQFQLTITPDARVLIHGQTTFFPIVTTMYQIRLLPSATASVQEDADQSTNTLTSSFPPTDAREGYPDLRDVVYYLRQATARALTDHLETRVQEWTASAAHTTDQATAADEDEDEATDEPTTWTKSIKGTVLQNPTKTHEVIIEVANESDEDLADEPSEETTGALQPLELRLFGVWQVDGQPNKKKWAWSVNDVGKQQDNLVDAARAVVKGELQ